MSPEIGSDDDAMSTKSHRTIAELLLKSLNRQIDDEENFSDSFMLICNSVGAIAAIVNFTKARRKYQNVIFLDYLLAIPLGTWLPGTGIYAGGAGRQAILELVKLAIASGKAALLPNQRRMQSDFIRG